MNPWQGGWEEGADGSEQVARWTLKIEFKKATPPPPSFTPEKCQHSWFRCCLSTLYQCDFSAPASLAPPSVLHLSWSHSVHCSGLSLPLALSVHRCINALSTSSLRGDSGFRSNCFSAGDNVHNSLPAPRCHSGGPFSYNQTDWISVFVCGVTTHPR